MPGACHFGDGDRYTGAWVADLQQGQGSCLHADGSKYRGEWLQGLRHGQGTCNYANGDAYTGTSMCCLLSAYRLADLSCCLLELHCCVSTL